MVKADYKHDYYADLDLTGTADQDTIKKRYRELAKQYHPDRNPGREGDVVPIFQAIQAAHEILGDLSQKTKYDAERAKLINRSRDVESPLFRKPPPPPPRRTDSGFTATSNSAYAQSTRQPPRRDPSETRYAPQSAPRPRPQSATTSVGDKFTHFARAGTQQWDKARYEDATRAEGLRGMNAMRGGQMPQTSPLRPPHPTAPRSTSQYPNGNEPSPGFPGLNRNSSQRRGYTSSSGADEPRSTYSRYNRSDRDRPPTSGQYSNVDSPHAQRPHESLSPLRPTRSFNPNDLTNDRPGLSRTSSRYAHTSGERTDPNASNLGRSASVRTSPIERDRGPFGNQRVPEETSPRPRHRSHSPPNSKNSNARFQYLSESSSEDETTPPPKDRRKAPLRRPQTSTKDDTPGLTGYFPKTNYTRVQDEDEIYDYPAPDAQGTPTRKPFPDLASPMDGYRLTADERLFATTGPEAASQTNSQSETPETTDNRPGFSAQDWHEQFENHADMFGPPDPANRDRKSPTKTTKTRAPLARSYAPSKEKRRDPLFGEIDPNIMAGARHVDAGHSQDKADAFQPPKLASNFAEQVSGSRRPSYSKPIISPGSRSEASHPENARRPVLDEMDVDTPTPNSRSPENSDNNYNVTVEEERSPTTSPIEESGRHIADPAMQPREFDLDDLKRSGPFVPSEAGLHGLSDLRNGLPFPSKPAETLDALHHTPSNSLRDLNLPRPPKVPYCPGDNELRSDTWAKFTENMTTYMHEWNKFNAAMIEHFRARQEAVTHGMYRNWVYATGDGASAEDYEASRGSDKAGYATYMTWLEDDRKCRTWWDVAFEEHRICLEELGRVRRKVKELQARAG